MSFTAPERGPIARWLGSFLLAVGFLVTCSLAALAQEIGSCNPSTAGTLLDANHVRAAIYNGGNLYWNGDGHTYTVPKGGQADAVFAANLWIGGMVGEELRFSGTEYGAFAFFPGPLTEQGELPNPTDCSSYDRIFEITRRDLDVLETTGVATDDIVDWPWHLGAPVADGDGDADNYDLKAGDRPDITGHEMHWWVMNDLGSSNRWSETPPLGVEVRASAFSVLSEDRALNNTTFYRYEIRNPQPYAIDSVWIGWWFDVDVGNSEDDFIGADTTLRMGFAYNASDIDPGSYGYGKRPPAIGVDFIQGPIADSDGVDNDADGAVDEAGERRPMTTFMYYSSDYGPVDIPPYGHGAYLAMRAHWPNGTPLTIGGAGYEGEEPIGYFWPGDPVTQSYWSAENTDGEGSRGYPHDIRFVAATGPTHLAPGAHEEIVIAVIWARGEDRLDSITELREADRIVQTAWDAGLIDDALPPSAPSAGPALTSPAHDVFGQPLDVSLEWQPQEHATDYVVEVAANPDFEGPAVRRDTTILTKIDIDGLEPFTDYFWRVISRSAVYAPTPSDAQRFRTSAIELGQVGLQTIPGTSVPAFVEVSGPGGIDPCGPEAVSTDGCAETGGNLVYHSENSTGEFILHNQGVGTEGVVGDFAPNDYEIRFTERGSYAIHAFSSEVLAWVPFEIWDIGPTGFFSENDMSDDIQLIPVLNGECEFAYGEPGDELKEGWKPADMIYGYYAVDSYDDWEAAVVPLVESADEPCYLPEGYEPQPYRELIDFDGGRPLQRVTFHGDPEAAAAPREGTIIRFFTTPPPEHAPIHGAPAIGTGPHVQPMRLTWNAPRGPVTSHLQISTEPNFEEPAFDATTTGESFIVSGLEEGRTHYWRVRLAQPESPWSDSWTFIAGEVTNVASEPAAELPRELTLEQNYPNPFNPSTTIRFGLPEAGAVTVIVYDLLGRRLATLIDEPRAAGWHEVRWDASTLASGVYVYTIRTDRQTRSRSMILMR